MVSKRDQWSRDETRRPHVPTPREGVNARQINGVRVTAECGPGIAPESVAMKETSRKQDDVVLLADLAPRADVKGGAGRRFFGERLDAWEGAEMADEEVKRMKRTTSKTTSKVKDLAPKSGNAVKGGVVGPCDRKRK